MCGAKSRILGRKVIELLIQKSMELFSQVSYIQEHKEEFLKAISEYTDPSSLGDISDLTIQSFVGRLIYAPKEELLDLANWILSVKFASINTDNDKDLTTSEILINDPISIVNDKVVMVNYMYDIGYNVKRLELSKAFNGYENFVASYANTIDHQIYVRIQDKAINGCEYLDQDGNPTNEISLAMDGKKIRLNKKRHTFLVYKSGLVMQSSPGDENAEIVYNKFMARVETCREETAEFLVPHVLKYKLI